MAMSVFAWVAMTLYQDKVDNLCVQEFLRSPESGSIYQCFRIFLHGFCLYVRAHYYMFSRILIFLFVIIIGFFSR